MNFNHEDRILIPLEKTSVFPPGKKVITLKISQPLPEKIFNSHEKTFNFLKKLNTTEIIATPPKKSQPFEKILTISENI